MAVEIIIPRPKVRWVEGMVIRAESKEDGGTIYRTGQCESCRFRVGLEAANDGVDICVKGESWKVIVPPTPQKLKQRCAKLKRSGGWERRVWREKYVMGRGEKPDHWVQERMV